MGISTRASARVRECCLSVKIQLFPTPEHASDECPVYTEWEALHPILIIVFFLRGLGRVGPVTPRNPYPQPKNGHLSMFLSYHDDWRSVRDPNRGELHTKSFPLPRFGGVHGKDPLQTRAKAQCCPGQKRSQNPKKMSWADCLLWLVGLKKLLMLWGLGSWCCLFCGDRIEGEEGVGGICFGEGGEERRWDWSIEHGKLLSKSDIFISKFLNFVPTNLLVLFLK